MFLREVMGLTLADQELEEVEDHTEGWLVGLRLLGLSLQECTDPRAVLEELHGSQHYILDYLMEEVLRRQQPSVQTFLVRTCVLERLSASLCDAVLEQTGSQELLELLEQANVFVVSVDRQRRWYRYHALFAEALRYRLESTQAELVPALHHRASVWYAEHGQTTEAIAHAITAREWSWAADLLEQVSALIWGNSEHARVRHWLEQLPAEVVRSRPRLCLAYAQTLFMVAPYTTMERWLHDAETALQATLPTPTNETAEPGAFPPSERQERDNLLGEIAAYRAIITGYYLGEGHATLACCQQALAHLSAQNLLARAEVAYAQSLASHACGDIVAAIQSAREATALAQAAGDTSSTILYTSGTAYSLHLHGKLHEVVRFARQAALLGTAPVGLPPAMVCSAYIFHADVLREWNQLDEALELVLQAVRLGEQTETIVMLYIGYTVLMRVYLARGEMDAARSAFQQAKELLAKTYSPYRRDVYVIGDWVQFWVASGALDRATHWAEELAQSARVHSPFAREREDVARARILALTVLAQAVQLAEPEGYIRRFVDEGPQIAVLLSRLREQQRKHGPTPYLDTVLAAFRQDGTAQERAGQRTTAQPLLDPLSARELEVLQLLARGDSNPEIAEVLVLSVQTVKSYVCNIFSKLGVKNRVQAVARARALGLLSEEPSTAST